MNRLTASLATFVVGACLALGGSLPAMAADSRPFDPASFAAARSEGKPIIVDITAAWCPTCAAQKPIIEGLTGNPTYRDMIVFHVDFDDQKDVVRQLGAQMQSTLIAYHGELETGRSVGDTDPKSIAALFQSALGK